MSDFFLPDSERAKDDAYRLLVASGGDGDPGARSAMGPDLQNALVSRATAMLHLLLPVSAIRLCALHAGDDRRKQESGARRAQQRQNHGQKTAKSEPKRRARAKTARTLSGGSKSKYDKWQI